MKLFFVSLLIVLQCYHISLNYGAAPTAIISCKTLTTGSYYLTNNLTWSGFPELGCLVVNTDNVAINGMQI